MQFIHILTEKEFSDLHRRIEKSEVRDNKTIQILCTMVATHMPVKFWGREIPEPWGCIHNSNRTGEMNRGYCDHCPVSDYCPEENKRWSK